MMHILFCWLTVAKHQSEDDPKSLEKAHRALFPVHPEYEWDTVDY
jgi:hypothetical protein